MLLNICLPLFNFLWLFFLPINVDFKLNILKRVNIFYIILILLNLKNILSTGSVNNLINFNVTYFLRFFEIEVIFKVNDSLNLLVIISVIVLISSLVQYYSVDYLEHELEIIRFLALINLFTSFMNFLVLSNDNILTLIGWEGVGIISYLLINFWNLRVEANKSSLKAFFINKIGDSAFIFLITLFFYYLKTNDNSLSFLLIYFKHEMIYSKVPLLMLFFLTLTLTACSKSAQIIFNVWLPDAMEGPTPVSTLIHSSTMVAAGFVLYLKLFIILELNTSYLFFLISLLLITSLISTVVSLVEEDVKNSLANSTISQLSFIIISLVLLSKIDSLILFISHAFYKSSLFLIVGIFLHDADGEQDSGYIGCNFFSTPFLYNSVLLAVIVAVGFPATLTHHAKFNLINNIYSYNLSNYYLLWILSELTILITIISLSTFYLNILDEGDEDDGFSGVFDKISGLAWEELYTHNGCFIFLLLLISFSSFLFFMNLKKSYLLAFKGDLELRTIIITESVYTNNLVSLLMLLFLVISFFFIYLYVEEDIFVLTELNIYELVEENVYLDTFYNYISSLFLLLSKNFKFNLNNNYLHPYFIIKTAYYIRF